MSRIAGVDPRDTTWPVVLVVGAAILTGLAVRALGWQMVVAFGVAAVAVSVAALVVVRLPVVEHHDDADPGTSPPGPRLATAQRAAQGAARCPQRVPGSGARACPFRKWNRSTSTTSTSSTSHPRSPTWCAAGARASCAGRGRVRRCRPGGDEWPVRAVDHGYDLS